jgi:glycosyltransferase involved in cell wall biosynthesis
MKAVTVKILLINNDKGWSGGQENLMDLGGELVRRGVELHFVVRVGSPSERRFRELGPVYPMPHHGLGDVRALGILAAAMRRERFDIISVNREHDLLFTVLARWLAFPLSRPGRLMMTYHTTSSRPHPFLAAVDGVVCISEHVRTRLLVGNPGVAARTDILYHGIRLGLPPGAEKFRRDRERRFFRGLGFPLIGMAGEFWKNQQEMVEVLHLLLPEFPDLMLAFVGDNTDLGLIEPVMATIERLGVADHVVFTGRVPRERMADIFFDFDLSVTTHRNEGFGIVHLESLAAGTPVVSYDEGGMVDILKSGEAGRVVHGGPAEFAATVAVLLADHEARFAMGARGYEMLRREYSVEAMGGRYLAYYRRLLGES